MPQPGGCAEHRPSSVLASAALAWARGFGRPYPAGRARLYGRVVPVIEIVEYELLHGKMLENALDLGICATGVW